MWSMRKISKRGRENHRSGSNILRLIKVFASDSLIEPPRQKHEFDNHEVFHIHEMGDGSAEGHLALVAKGDRCEVETT
jgi:hypothetical protein